MGEQEAQRCAGAQAGGSLCHWLGQSKAAPENSEECADTRVALRLTKKGDSRKEKVKCHKGGVMGCWHLSCRSNRAGGLGEGWLDRARAQH